MAQIYTQNGQQVYDYNGQTFSATTGQPISQSTTPNTQNTTPAAPTAAPNAPTTQNLALTGVSTPNTTSTTPNLSNLAPGASGADVASLQKFLMSLGYNIPAIQSGEAQPGYFGPQTKQALSQFQQAYNVPTGQYAGYFGPQTKSVIAQNQELAKQFQSLFEQQKGTQAPQTDAEARATIANLQQQGPQDYQQQFMDSLTVMNPFEAQLYQQMSQLLGTQTSQQSLTDFYKQEIEAQGIPALNMELADIKRIMEGTEDDIRDEISRSGGSATESQVQAMSAARNKTLLKKASYLADVLNAKNDYIDRMVSLTQADREQAGKDFDRKLGLTQTLFDMTQTMQNNAKENYKTIIDSVGWGGLAAALKGNKAHMAKVESLFGLEPGELQYLADYKKPMTEMEALELEGKRLAIQQLRQDITRAPQLETELQNFGTAANPHYKLINSKTGAIIADYGSNVPAGDTMQLAYDNQKIQDITALLNNSSLDSAVGPNKLARASLNTFTGAKSAFIAGVEQLVDQLNLDKLIQAKAAGATFGALSNNELQMLASAATKIGTWRLKDDAGNVYGYKVNEEEFKAELDKINNFAKIDFLLKGGDPASVNIQIMDDGTMWTKNSNGSYTQIK